MFDVGFWELLIIALVLLLVIGPERLPGVAKQGAFLIRKARKSMFQLRDEMKSELDGTPFEEFQKVRKDISDFKNDIKQFGRDFADSADTEIAEVKKSVEAPESSTTNDATATAKADGSDSGKSSEVNQEPKLK